MLFALPQAFYRATFLALNVQSQPAPSAASQRIEFNIRFSPQLRAAEISTSISRLRITKLVPE
jgi:hypothetical protein